MPPTKNQKSRIKNLFALGALLTLAIAIPAAAPSRFVVRGRELYRDEKPHVPHGMVHVSMEHLPELAAMGIDSIHMDLPFNRFDPEASAQQNRDAFASFVKMADTAHENGMSVLWLFSFHYTPGWLYERFADVHMQAHDGENASSGFVRMCLNHPGFRDAARQWLQLMAELLGPHPATLAWCLWNEPFLGPPVDYHPLTVQAFHEWLALRYERIDALNAAWGSTHASFDQIAPPPPRETGKWQRFYDRMVAEHDGRIEAPPGAHAEPPLWMDWMRFRQDNFAAFFEWQAQVLRAADPDAIITSKIVPFDLYSSHAYGAAVNTEIWSNRFLDVVGMDLYSHLDEDFLARWKCDYFRSLSAGKPIWHTEFNFTFLKERGLATPQQWRTAFYYQLARGVNGLFNFMWADDIEYTLHYKGYRPAPVTHEIDRLCQQIQRLSPLLAGAEPAPAQVAVLHSTTTGLALAGDYTATADQTTIVELLYRSHTPFDFVTEKMVLEGALKRYRVLVAVGCVALGDNVLSSIETFSTEHGGHVLANARFAALDAYGRARDPHPPHWMGVRAKGLHRTPRLKTGMLELRREARSVEDKPVDVQVAMDTFSSRPITLNDGRVSGSGNLFGDEDTQLPWSGGGRHEQYWEDVEPLEAAQVLGRFEDGQAAIVATGQNLYIARDTCWVDDDFEAMIRSFLKRSGVVNRNTADNACTGEPAASVDLRQWRNGDTLILFVINSAPTLHYDGSTIDVQIKFDHVHGDVSDALTGETVPSRWRDFARVVPLRLEAGDVRVLTGRAYPSGWREEQTQHDELVDILEPDDRPYVAWRRSPNELWVYDRRTELGVGMHDVGLDQFELAKRLGIRLVRRTLYWYQVENTQQPGVHDAVALKGYDAIIQRAADAGIELVMIVHGNAPGTGWTNRHQSYERFARFMAFCAQRWPSVRYWELWNEMDVGFTDLFGASGPLPAFERGRCYAQMLKLAYPAIKSANPKAWVLTGGMSGYGRLHPRHLRGRRARFL